VLRRTGPERSKERFPVLLHPDLYRRLRDCGKIARSAIWKALSRLREGLWGGGTRVKRLRGVSRPVYEARVDSGDRLLFTMARAPLPPLTPLDTEPERSAVHLQVWDWVEHDDAERVARRNRSPEAEFLEMETAETFEIDEPPPHPGATFAEVGEETSEQLLQYLLPPEELDVALEEAAIKWYLIEPGALADEQEFQRLFDEGGEELELKLSREQYRILASPGPLLVAGSAGSGKTAISVHRLAAAPSSALYLSYSPALVEHARRLYSDISAARGTSAQRKPDFFTFADLYRSLAKEPETPETPEMTEPLFREWFRRSGRPLDPALVWEELRSILKGACLALDRPMLHEAAYYELGKKRAPLFVDERPEIWRIAQRYQEWLGEEGRYDRIDLCRRAFSEVRQGRGRTWDVVVCDEVQDLTELEVAFVLALSRRADLSGVLLTGDTQQTIQPSGFRWAEARRLATRIGRRKEAPPVLRLRRNLRSVRPLVELANALLLLRREVFGRTEEDEPEEAAIEGPVPIEVPAPEEDVLAAIEGFGPRCAVLTLDDAETERLRERLGTSRVFHVRDAKGLEFESVVLWKLLAPDQDLIQRFLRGSDARMEREPRFKRLLQHLYVAVTRARRHLALYEGPEPHPFWGDQRFRARLERETVEALPHLFRPTASPAEWEKEGDYFLERGHFRQAAECYRRAARPEQEAEALARADEEREDWIAALARWAGLRRAARQAPLLDRLGRLAEAAASYREAGLEREARACEARLLENRKAWKEAAGAWEALGRYADAARCWERAAEGSRGLEAGDHEAAARCFHAAGQPKKAALALARHLEAQGTWGRAAAAYRVAGRTQSSNLCRARALEGANRPAAAAVRRERLGEIEPAVALYARAGRWLDVARLEPARPEPRRRLLPKLRELIEGKEWDQADRLLHARREVLLDKLPGIPWFLLTQGERLIWEELRDLERLEHRCRALRAESERAWSRAARHWSLAEEPGRAAEALGDRLRRAWPHPVQETPPASPEAPSAHPDREILRRLLQGTIPQEEARAAIRHLLQGCVACAREIERLKKPSSPASYDEAFSRIHTKITSGGLEALRRESPSPSHLYAELLAHEAVEGLVQVHSTRRYASLALCELLLRKSRELGIDDPERARKAADLAVQVAEQLDLDLYGAPVVQDVRAMAWAYLAESRRVQAEVQLAESSMGKAERLLEEGSGDPLARAELLTLKASLAGYCGRFDEAIRILNRASSIYRRLDERHLFGRTLLKKGTLLGNAGQHATALRLIRRSIDLIDPPREPRLIVCATHNLIWFLNESGRSGEADACIGGARRLYEQAGDRRHLSRLRWLEGKLASRPREAEGALLAARDGLAREGLVYEAALAAMDLAVLYVQERREADMLRQADQLFPLFRSDDMYRETATALQSFQQQTRPEDTARLIDELSGWVERARIEKNPPALALPF
jgi:DNA helicase II / ATP-dependent DNA helicase PcrA